MQTQSIDQFLTQTLQDHRLTGSERQALRQVLHELPMDEQSLAFYRHRAFALARTELANGDVGKVLDWLEEVLKVLQPQVRDESEVSEACFSPGHDCSRRIAGLFTQARKSADVCVFTITDDRISAANLEAHQRGVAVRIITDNDKAFDLGSDIDRFRTAGISVRLDRTEFHMHHKFAIFDGTLLLNGSYNWTRGAAEQNHENIVLIGDHRLIAAFAGTFERLWQQFG